MKSPDVPGMHLVELAPESPSPRGAPAWAERCEVVVTPMYPARLRPWIIGVGALGCVACLATLRWFSAWGMAPLPFSLMVLWFGVRPSSTTEAVPAEEGRYLAWEDPDQAKSGSVQAAIVALLGTLGVGVNELGRPGAGLGGWLGVGTLVVMNGYFVLRAIRRNHHAELMSSARFRELADAARPLAALERDSSHPKMTP